MPPAPSPLTPRLWERREGKLRHLFTEAATSQVPLFGERWSMVGRTTLRHIDPFRSKLGAAIVTGVTIALPRPGETWLYLGAASGTTASYVADLVGPSGAVYAVEKSPRPFVRLVELASRYPHVGPILADARRPTEYLDLVPPVDGIYADVAQPDQAALLLANAREFLRVRGSVLLAIKGSSMGRSRSGAEHAEATRDELHPYLNPMQLVPLEPFHKAHAMLAGTALSAIATEERHRPEPAASSHRPLGAGLRRR
ncbi:MAG: fibrillarin-like rRNA/tRNA 2'-O-methyltransferase [Thermoplasmata archaeon]|nr:fibrillarin-like rRNA/tRNA 2'-O-methyltransferase [Thermoplasmata archaeon]